MSSWTSALWLHIAAALLLIEPGYSQEPLPSTDWIDAAKLEAGAVVVSTVDEGDFAGRVNAAVSIDAPPRVIWDVMTDCPSAPEFIPGVLSCELLDTMDDGQAQLFRQELKYSWYLPRLTYVFRLDYFPYRQIDFRRISGRPRKLEGSWWLKRDPDGATQVVYSVHLDPGFFVPKFLVRRALKKDLPTALEALRERVEGPRDPLGAAPAL